MRFPLSAGWQRLPGAAPVPVVRPARGVETRCDGAAKGDTGRDLAGVAEGTVE